MKFSEDSTVVADDGGNNYSIPNTLAVLALLSSFFAPLCLMYLQLLFVPLIGLGAGGLSIYLLRGVKSKKTGLPLAVVAVLVSSLFGAWSIAQTKYKYDFYYRTAAGFGEKWLKILADNNREEAFEFHLNEGSRQLDTADLKDFYQSNSQARSGMELFYQQPGVMAVQKRGPGAKWKYAGRRGIRKISTGDSVKVAMRDESGPRPMTIVITLVRNPSETADNTLACWHIYEVNVET
jgi:hypothetical protein